MDNSEEERQAERRHEIFKNDQLFLKWVNASSMLALSREKLGISLEQRDAIWKMLHGSEADVEIAVTILSELNKQNNET
jgi:hypothetical protein